MSFSRILYTLLIIVICGAGYYLLEKSNTESVQIAPDQELPMFTGRGLENINYNEKGVRSYRVISTSLEHYASSGDTIFDQPELTIFKLGSEEEWKITAKRGVLTEEQVLTLYDDVLARNLLPESAFDTMSTDKLFINLNNRDFWADQEVLLVGPQFETEGNAMKGNFGTNDATLYNQVQGRYENLTP
ncbi:LPS export ABC transporter periplasmic protein LptC [Vibrio maerlii]|uniref:LPS export ABC transporter periplasmic protein LptC n=1 Tax=Vibrio maerlii TaxID=2231648 RepID=UPI000E3C6666|nr:LPS export ABC transporter periplasmic protein LptC [Vibrio maerlii]